MTLWLLGIAVNLLTLGMFYDLAVRDVEIAIGAFALAQLTTTPGEERPASRDTRKAPVVESAVTQ